MTFPDGLPHALLLVVVLGLLLSMLGSWSLVFLYFILPGKTRLPTGLSLPGSPRIVPWGWPSIAIFIATWIVATNAAAVGYLALKGPPPEARRNRAEPANPRVETPGERGAITEVMPRFSAADQMIISSFASLAVLLIGPTILRAFTGATRADFGLALHHPVKEIVLGSVAFLLVTPVVMTIAFSAQRLLPAHPHQLEQMLRGAPTDASFVVLAYVSASLLAPLSEELTFRVVIQGWLRRLYLKSSASAVRISPVEIAPAPLVLSSSDQEGDPSTRTMDDASPVSPHSLEKTGSEKPRAGLLGRFMPILVTSALFASLHYEQMPAPIPIFFLSIALGALYEWTGSFLACVALHGLFNAFNTTLLLLALNTRMP